LQETRDRSAQHYAIHQNRKFYANATRNNAESDTDQLRGTNSLAQSPPKPFAESIDVERLKADKNTIFAQMIMKP
jgi:hypothetical protein